MIDILFVMFFTFIPVLTILILKITGFSVFKVGLVQFTTLSLFVFSFFGTLPLFFGWDEYRFNTGVNDKELVFQIMLMSGWTMLVVVLGAIFAKKVLGQIKGVEAGNIKQKNVELILVFFLFFLVCVVLMLYLSKLSSIALFAVLEFGSSAAGVSRSVMGNDFSGKYHWYKVFIYDFANIVTYVTFYYYLTYRNKLNTFLFLASLCLSVFTAIMATEKGPIVWLLIGMFVTYTLAKNDGAYPVRKLIPFVIMVMATLIVSYIYFMGSLDVLSALTSVFSRTFAGSIEPVYYYLQYIPQHHDWLYGQSFPNPGNLLPHTPFLLPKEIMSGVHPELTAQGIVGSMPAVFWAEMYANFSWVGVLITPFFVGFLLYSVECVFSFMPATPLKVGVYVWVLLHYKNLANSGLFGFIFDFYLIIIVFVYITIILVNEILVVCTRKTYFE